MAAVAHASPADLRRLSFVGTGATVRALPARVPTTVYRRRRAAALLVVVMALLGLAFALNGLLAGSGSAPPLASSGRQAVGGGVYVVQPGDTFWEIARRLAPGEDPRPLVAELVAAHGGANLRAGERLHLPDRL